MALEQPHGAADLGVGAGASARVGGLLEALHADGGDEVRHAQHVAAELLVDERGVREREERAVGVRLAQLDEIAFAHERLSTRVDVDVCAQFRALTDDGVQLVVGEVLLVAVLGGPAAGAAQVAGARGIHEDGPGDVAAVLLAHGLLLRPGHEVAVDEKRLHQAVAHGGVRVLERAHDELVPVVLLVDGGAEGAALAGEQVGRRHLVEQIHDFDGVGLGVGEEVVEGFLERGALYPVGWFHRLPLFRAVLRRVSPLGLFRIRS